MGGGGGIDNFGISLSVLAMKLPVSKIALILY